MSLRDVRRGRTYSIACPKCGASPGTSCRTLLSGRVTDVHLARLDAAYGQPVASPDPSK